MILIIKVKSNSCKQTQMDFECLIPVLELIGKHSSGRTVFSLRCVSWFFNTFFSLYTPATKKQIDTAKIMAKSEENNIVLRSGVGSGKSLTCMMLMREYLKRGIKSMILIDPSRFSIWTLELKKWSKVLKLPKYCILHGSFSEDFKARSDILLASRRLTCRMSSMIEELIENNYLCYICDESNGIPTLVYRVRESTSKPVKCVIVNATYRGKIKGFSHISYRKDDELASKPNLDVVIFRVPSIVSSRDKVLEIIRSNMGKKTLIYAERDMGMTFEEELPNVIGMRSVSDQREKMRRMEGFQKSKSGILVCDDSCLRGFNMHADTAFYIADRLHRPYLIQFLGRIHRPSPFHKNVTLIVFTDNDGEEIICGYCDVFNEVIKCCILYVTLPSDLVLLYLDKIKCRNVDDIPRAVIQASNRARKHSLKEIPSFPEVTIEMDSYTGWDVCYI